MPYGTVKVDNITTSTQTVAVDGLAPKASPALTGTPTAPTASAGTNSTQIATTAYVKSQAYATSASPTFTTDVNLSAQAPIKLFDSDSSNWVALRAPTTVATNVTWTLPDADGSANQVLTTNGSGQLGWVSMTSGASVGVALALG